MELALDRIHWRVVHVPGFDIILSVYLHACCVGLRVFFKDALFK